MSTGFTMKKNTAPAIATNWIVLVMKAPYRKRASLIVNVRLLKSGLPMIIAITGMIRSLTSELTTAANARPITNATASSRMFPRSRKSRNSLSISLSSLDAFDRSGGL